MSELMRVSLSIEKPLLDRLEGLIENSRYSNRSEYVRDLIREKLVENEWEDNSDVVGTITMIFNHHLRELQKRLTQTQHNHHEIILATTHLHLDHDICMEVIITRGPAAIIKELYEMLRQQKGVLHVTLSMNSTGTQLN